MLFSICGKKCCGFIQIHIHTDKHTEIIRTREVGGDKDIWYLAIFVLAFCSHQQYLVLGVAITYSHPPAPVWVKTTAPNRLTSLGLS